MSHTSGFQRQETRAIRADVLTLREAARRTRTSPAYIKGRADAMGEELTPCGRALVMTERQFRRVSKGLRIYATPMSAATA